MALVGGLLGNLFNRVAQFNRPPSLTNPNPQQQQAIQTFQAARTSPIYGPYRSTPQAQAPRPSPIIPSSQNLGRPATYTGQQFGPPSSVSSGGGGQVQGTSTQSVSQQQQSAPQDNSQQYQEQTPQAPSIVHKF